MKSLEYHAEANRRSYEKHKAERLAKQKAYRQSNAGKSTQARKDRKQQKINPVHWGARAAVWRAIKSGKLNRPQFCEQPSCYEDKTEAHHWHGYDKEHWLDVVFLCNYHHVEAHQTPEWRLSEIIGNIYENLELIKQGEA